MAEGKTQSPNTFETKLDAVLGADNIVTKQELDELRTFVSCSSDAERTRLQNILNNKKGIADATKGELQVLISACQKPVESPETQKVSSFEKVFEGARSDMLSKNVQYIKMMILPKFESIPNLSLSDTQKDNLATATIDRVLSDPDFLGIVDGLGTGLTSMIGKLFGESRDGDMPEGEKVKEKKGELEPSMTAMQKRIAAVIDRATSPLVELLKKQPAGLSGFLSNPSEMAKYTGGEIPADITKMNPTEQAQYIKNLNTRVLELDGKIVPLEALREQGMDFMATSPNWMKDIFKWLLNLPLIGNILASFLGYADGKDAIDGVGEEFRQRRSLLILREFGSKVTNIEGKERVGKYSGDIKILEGQDLSKLDRKELVDFFQFTKEEGINSGTPDFWKGVFHNGKITVKDEKGVEIEYALKPPIDSKDLDKDFKGLYIKLNSFLKQKKDREYGEQQQAKKPEISGEQVPSIKTGNDAPKSKIGAEQISTLSVLGKLAPEQRSEIMMGYVSGKGAFNFPKDTEIEDRNAMIMEFASLNRFLKEEPLFEKYIKAETGKKEEKLSLQDVWQNKDRAILAMNTQKAPSTMIAGVQEKPATKSIEVARDPKTLLAEAFISAHEFPFLFGTESVKFEAGELVIGEKRFSIKVSNGGSMSSAVSGIDFIGGDVELKHSWGPTRISRTEIIAGIPVILDMKPSSDKEIVGGKGKLIITRVA